MLYTLTLWSTPCYIAVYNYREDGRIIELLLEHGYVRRGLANYIRPEDPFFDDLQEHGIKTLMGYSPHEKNNFLGFGLSSISFIENTFYLNKPKLKDYYQQIDQNEIPLQRKSSYRVHQSPILL